MLFRKNISTSLVPHRSPQPSVACLRQVTAAAMPLWPSKCASACIAPACRSAPATGVSSSSSGLSSCASFAACAAFAAASALLLAIKFFGTGVSVGAAASLITARLAAMKFFGGGCVNGADVLGCIFSPIRFAIVFPNPAPLFFDCLSVNIKNTSLMTSSVTASLNFAIAAFAPG